MQTYAGIDLHSSNNFIGVIDAKDKRLYSKRHDNNLKQVVKALGPFKKNLQGIAIESTYNWYWLVDGLQEHGFNVFLANPAAIQAYSGLKHTDDKWDSFWLAHMLRLGILPQGYIYPKQHRAVRDLRRRRLMFVRQRTSQILSLQSMITRNRGLNYTGADIKRFRNEFIDVLFTDPHLNFTAKRNIETIRFLDRIVSEIETQVNSQIKVKKQFRLLLTTPGIGTILGLTITLEVGDIDRFFKAGRYSSYCRCVESKKISNGNRYLAWAYVEAANHAIRTCPKAQGFFQRKMSKRNRVLATKAVANKLTKATYYIMRDQLAFDAAKLFG
jgi:transposase